MGEAPSPEDLLLMAEVSAMTRRSIDTLRWLRARGEGPASFRSGRRVYYRRSAVTEWIAAQERASAGDAA
jgi:predicted DNA-binding transcriptional regulator AlpA